MGKFAVRIIPTELVITQLQVIAAQASTNTKVSILIPCMLCSKNIKIQSILY